MYVEEIGRKCTGKAATACRSPLNHIVVLGRKANSDELCAMPAQQLNKLKLLVQGLSVQRRRVWKSTASKHLQELLGGGAQSDPKLA